MSETWMMLEDWCRQDTRINNLGLWTLAKYRKLYGLPDFFRVYKKNFQVHKEMIDKWLNVAIEQKFIRDGAPVKNKAIYIALKELPDSPFKEFYPQQDTQNLPTKPHKTIANIADEFVECVKNSLDGGSHFFLFKIMDKKLCFLSKIDGQCWIQR